MCSRRRSATERRCRQAGFTLVELMVGVLVGLLASLAVTQVLVTAEAHKRTTAAGSEALVNGALALGTVQRALMSAGYGYSSSARLVGCPLVALHDHHPVPGFPAALAPVFITQGTALEPSDTIRVLASGKKTYSLPLQLESAYAPGATAFAVHSILGVETGDFLVAARSDVLPCEVFRVTDAPAPGRIPRADAPAAWNAVGYPFGTYPENSQLLNLGPEPLDVTYRVADDSLRADTLRINGAGAPSYERGVALFPDVVSLQAYYGKDTQPAGAPDGTVDVWDTVTPATNQQWRQVIAVRVALVVRSGRMEAADVTAENPQWDVGPAIALEGALGCGNSRCVTLQVSHLPNWKRYRYQVFETTVPLRNMVWTS